jgi:site-specific recombinase XerD
MGAPVITVFVRHSSDCKYKGDEFSRRCKCRKHLRWTQNGKQYRRKAGTRSWEEAEEVKRNLEGQLAGRTPAQQPDDNARILEEAVDLFIQDKTVQGLSASVLGKYTRELERLRAYCERQNVYTVQGITRELLTGFCATWEAVYPSSTTRSKVRERCRSFFRYCYEAQWLPRIPSLPKIQIEEPPTLPLSAEEYAKLLDTIYGEIGDKAQAARVHALFQLMRWSGLAIRDALTLERKEIQQDRAKGVYRIATARQKTGTHVSVPIPPEVAAELLAVLNGNEKYVFWSGKGEEESVTKNWSKYYIAPVFKAAGLAGDGYMMSHRLRDTFAVDLLEKGVPIEEVSKALGHESIKTTERHYAKWVKARQDRLDSLVMGTWAAPGKAPKHRT